MLTQHLPSIHGCTMQCNKGASTRFDETQEIANCDQSQTWQNHADATDAHRLPHTRLFFSLVVSFFFFFFFVVDLLVKRSSFPMGGKQSAPVQLVCKLCTYSPPHDEKKQAAPPPSGLFVCPRCGGYTDCSAPAGWAFFLFFFFLFFP